MKGTPAVRLPEDKIKEALLHPNLDVRDTAIRYFYSSTTPDQTLMPLAIEAIEKYGRTSAFSFTHYLNLLPQTEQTIAWVIAELNRDFQGTPEEKYFYFMNLSRLLNHADIRLVVQRAPEILHAPHLDPKERPSFRERLEMFGWDADTCWQAMQQYCEANRDKNNFEEFDLGHALRIVEALARQAHEYQDQIIALISEQEQDFRHDARKWLQPLMANLAGQMRLQAAIPSLVGNLGHRYSFLSDESMFALARIGSEEVVVAVCDLFPGSSRDFRLWASDLLCKIHRDVVVQRVLELLPGETDLAIRLNLCEALLEYFSFESIESARQLIMEHELTPDLRRLRWSLIAVCKITGNRFPEFDLWQEEAKKDTQEEQTKTHEFQKMVYEAGGDVGLLVKQLKAEIAKKQLRIKILEAEVAEKKKALADQTRAQVPRPIPRLPNRPVSGVGSSSLRKPIRVGRNDPCPCGSGKKFKNCCMKKQSEY